MIYWIVAIGLLVLPVLVGKVLHDVSERYPEVEEDAWFIG